jgi:hypothetical protein
LKIVVKHRKNTPKKYIINLNFLLVLVREILRTLSLTRAERNGKQVTVYIFLVDAILGSVHRWIFNRNVANGNQCSDVLNFPQKKIEKSKFTKSNLKANKNFSNLKLFVENPKENFQ